MMFHLTDESDEKVATTICKPTVPEAQTETKLKFSDIKEMAISNKESLKEIHYKIITEQQGITEGVTIAEGHFNVKEFELFTKID